MNGADSYLYFEMQITGDTGVPTSTAGAGQNFFLDSSAQSIIQRLRIEGGWGRATDLKPNIMSLNFLSDRPGRCRAGAD